MPYGLEPGSEMGRAASQKLGNKDLVREWVELNEPGHEQIQSQTLRQEPIGSNRTNLFLLAGKVL